MANSDARSLIAVENARNHFAPEGAQSVPAVAQTAAANDYLAPEGISTGGSWVSGGGGGGEVEYSSTGQCFPTGR